jgi:hypothetical protein
MKERHKASIRGDALETLKYLKIEVGQDFYTLSSSQVEKLLEEADRVKYRKPRNANGSRGRYFHDRLQRHARMKV